jgi:hypothetical protein
MAPTEIVVQGFRDAHAARVAREQAMKQETTAAHGLERSSAGGYA